MITATARAGRFGVPSQARTGPAGGRLAQLGPLAQIGALAAINGLSLPLLTANGLAYQALLAYHVAVQQSEG